MPDEETRDWVPLRDYVEALFRERDARVSERSAASQHALDRAADDLERRLHNLNELRGNVITREEYEAKHELLAAEIRRMRQEQVAAKGADTARTRITATLIASLGSLSGFVFIVVALLTHGFK